MHPKFCFLHLLVVPLEVKDGSETPLLPTPSAFLNYKEDRLVFWETFLWGNAFSRSYIWKTKNLILIRFHFMGSLEIGDWIKKGWGGAFSSREYLCLMICFTHLSVACAYHSSMKWEILSPRFNSRRRQTRSLSKNGFSDCRTISGLSAWILVPGLSLGESSVLSLKLLWERQKKGTSLAEIGFIFPSESS